MADPALFKRLSLLYFAAASYSETVRRLGRPHLAPGFLLNAHPQFGLELRECAALAAAAPPGPARAALFDRIDRAIEPFDTAGLLDRTAATGIRCSLMTSSRAQRSSRRRPRTCIGCWSAAGWRVADTGGDGEQRSSTRRLEARGDARKAVTLCRPADRARRRPNGRRVASDEGRQTQSTAEFRRCFAFAAPRPMPPALRAARPVLRASP